jgi:nitrous oxide reductase accessory protein NosL
MKRILALLFASLLLLPLVALAEDTDIAKVKACKYCGMDRQMFAHSRIWIEYVDGSPEGLCSLHCAAVEFAVALDRRPTTIWVGDFETKQLIDADKAVWVMGGEKPGVMTRRPKWAFAEQAGADRFIKASGGAVITFDQAIKSAYEDMYDDTKMIRDRREAKRKAASEKK